MLPSYHVEPINIYTNKYLKIMMHYLIIASHQVTLYYAGVRSHHCLTERLLPCHQRLEYHIQLARMSFDEILIFDLTAAMTQKKKKKNVTGGWDASDGYLARQASADIALVRAARIPTNSRGASYRVPCSSGMRGHRDRRA